MEVLRLGPNIVKRNGKFYQKQHEQEEEISRLEQDYFYVDHSQSPSDKTSMVCKHKILGYFTIQQIQDRIRIATSYYESYAENAGIDTELNHSVHFSFYGDSFMNDGTLDLDIIKNHYDLFVNCCQLFWKHQV